MNTMERVLLFWSKVAIGAPDECWPWQAAKDRDGYGFFYLDERDQRAHRVAKAFSGFPIDPDKLGCHTCDNPSCCNPQHIFEGTPKVNWDDMIEKRGYPSIARKVGVQRKGSKLNDDAVRFIRAQGGQVTNVELGQKFGVSAPQIGEVRAGRSWRHVQDVDAPSQD